MAIQSLGAKFHYSPGLSYYLLAAPYIQAVKTRRMAAKSKMPTAKQSRSDYRQARSIGPGSDMHVAEYLRVRRHYPSLGLRVGREVPIAHLVRAPKQYTVRA